MRVYLGLAALSVLTACGGSGGSGVTPPVNPNGPDVMGVNIPGGVVNRNFVAQASRSQIDLINPASPGAVGEYQVQLRFLSASVAELTSAFFGPISLTYDPTFDVFIDPIGEWEVGVYDNINGETPAKDMLYFVILNFPGSGVRYVDTFVHGNRAPVSAMPTTAGATYSGLVSTVAGDGQSTVGSFSLNADFANSQVGGTLFGVLPADTSLDFDLVPGTINGNGFITGLTSVGNATTVNPIISRINGRFFGPTAGEVGGIIVLDTGAGNASGHFGGSAP